MSTPLTHVHEGQPLLHAGAPVESARLVMLLVHGRGATADGILGLAGEFPFPDIAYLAPQAAGRSWYPLSFLAPMPDNEPGLSSALQRIGDLVAQLGGQGIAPDRIVIGGFSQGACLSLEFAARHPQRYAGIVAFSGGLIGPPGTPRDYPGTFTGTPVFLGCSDIDAHVPVARVHESADVFRRMGADVDARIYPGMGHTINEDEIAAVSRLLAPPPQGVSGG
jgi:predicted esterase